GLFSLLEKSGALTEAANRAQKRLYTVTEELCGIYPDSGPQGQGIRALFHSLIPGHIEKFG
ncbi:MAG: hypothetical protein LBS64_05855, partial [Spirochaetaceae bacterium]|nr:hypothetical protein [Spirochaetaceae bacterium]